MSEITKDDILFVASSYAKTVFKPTDEQINEILQVSNECMEDFPTDNFTGIIENCFYSMDVKRVQL